MRQVFTEAWQRRLAGQPLDPLQQLVSDVIAQHPEYHQLIEQPERALERDFEPDQGESNPFLHMGMHLGLHEQIGTNRPAGITTLYAELVGQTGDAHQVEHQIMECLGQMLWQAQRSGTLPDEQAYLECIRRLASSRGG